MTSELLTFLSCPVDQAFPLALTTAAARPDGTIEAGGLTCPSCGRQYPIEGGIPRLLPDPGLLPPVEAAEKRREQSQRDREARIYDRNLPLRLLSIAEIPAT